MVISLRPVELAFHLVRKRRLVDVILLLLQVLERTEMGVIQITISEVRSLLTNCELNTPSFGGTESITCFLGVNLVRKTLNSVSIICITHGVFVQKLDLNIIICAFFSCRDGVTVLLDIVVLVEQISMSTFGDSLIWESIASSGIHLPPSRARS